MSRRRLCLQATITLVFQETGNTQIDTKIAFRILFEYSKKDAFLRKTDTCCVPSRHHITASKTKLFHLVTVLVKRSSGLCVTLTKKGSYIVTELKGLVYNITFQAIFIPFLSVQSRIVIQLFCLSSNLMVIVTLKVTWPSFFGGYHPTLMRAMTTLGWLPNAHRDIPVTSWFNYWLALNLWKNIFLIVIRFSV